MHTKYLPLLALIIFLPGCASTEHKDQQAIAQVIAQRHILHKEFLEFNTKGRHPKDIQANAKKYLEGIRKIDATHCPKDFRSVWIDYVQTWERKENQTLGQAGLELMALTTGAHTGNFAYNIEQSKKRNNADAWLEVERLAVVYGVDTREN